MKKIGVLNFQYSDHNYGAVLQAVALEHVLRKLDNNVEHINYIPLSTNKKTAKNYVIKLIDGLGLKRIIFKILKRKFIIKRKVSNAEVFECFRVKYLTRTPVYHSIEELANIAGKYDAVVVGSDQVWRPRMYTNINELGIYFLSFLEDKTKRISYAASFGVDHWEYSKEENITQLATKYLKKFTCISVRENTGVDICKNVFNVNACHVLDPTLLIGKDFFYEIIRQKKAKENNLINYYKLDLSESFLSGLEYLSQLSGFQTQNIYYKKNKDNSYEYYPVEEWLQMINDSSLIITDSFHCVCFSILFNKNFYCCLNSERGASRLESLLNELDLSDRLVRDDELKTISMSNKIDYSKVENILERKRMSSLDYILTAIKG